MMENMELREENGKLSEFAGQAFLQKNNDENPNTV